MYVDDIFVKLFTEFALLHWIENMLQVCSAEDLKRGVVRIVVLGCCSCMYTIYFCTAKQCTQPYWVSHFLKFTQSRMLFLICTQAETMKTIQWTVVVKWLAFLLLIFYVCEIRWPCLLIACWGMHAYSLH